MSWTRNEAGKASDAREKDGDDEREGIWDGLSLLVSEERWMGGRMVVRRVEGVRSTGTDTDSSPPYRRCQCQCQCQCQWYSWQRSGGDGDGNQPLTSQLRPLDGPRRALQFFQRRLQLRRLQWANESCAASTDHGKRLGYS
jgi:hypothetical protein